MVPGLVGAKMSASDPDSKIDLLEDPETVNRKIKKAFCEEGNITENGLLSFSKMVIFPILKGKPFHINRPEKFGGPLDYPTYQEMEDAFASKKLSPEDLKIGMVDQINAILVPIREKFSTPEMVKLIKDAYPTGIIIFFPFCSFLHI